MCGGGKMGSGMAGGRAREGAARGCLMEQRRARGRVATRRAWRAPPHLRVHACVQHDGAHGEEQGQGAQRAALARAIKVALCGGGQAGRQAGRQVAPGRWVCCARHGCLGLVRQRAPPGPDVHASALRAGMCRGAALAAVPLTHAILVHRADFAVGHVLWRGARDRHALQHAAAQGGVRAGMHGAGTAGCGGRHCAAAKSTPHLDVVGSAARQGTLARLAPCRLGRRRSRAGSARTC